MERPLFKPIGTPVWHLDTPALIVDLPTLEHNIATVHTFFRHREVKLRPHVSIHRCPPIAHQQLAAGGTVGGISVATLSEAEVFAMHGVDDIFVTTPMVTSAKMHRLCALAHHLRVTVPVDHPRNVSDLSAIATTFGVTIRVAVEVNTHTGRGGVAPGQPVLALAQAVHRAAHLDFAGLTMGTDPRVIPDPAAQATAWQQALQPLTDTRTALEKAGIDVPMVSVRATNYEIVGNTVGITEVRTGVYPLMDARHSTLCPGLRPAARVLTTITSHPEPGTAITDAGQKAIGIDFGLPLVAEIPGAAAMKLSAEHCCLQLDSHADSNLTLGDKIGLIPRDIGTCTNLYDYMYATRDAKLEAVWPVSARGRYR